MAGPMLVVIASMYTLWLAITSDDGLVADDYYKRGLAINRTLSRDQNAAANHYRATLVFDPGAHSVRATFSGRGVRPRVLRLRIVHPTRAGMDRMVSLVAAGDGRYEGAIGALHPGRWLITLDDASRKWRLTGEWHAPDQKLLRLTARTGGT